VSIFFADWLLTGVALLLPSIVGAFGAWRRKRVNDDIRQKHTTGYFENENNNNNNNNNIVVPVNGDDEIGRLDDVHDFSFPEDTRGTGSDTTGRDPSPEQSPTLPPPVASHDDVGRSSLATTDTGADREAGDRRSLTVMTSKGEELIVDIERNKAFTEAKIFVLLSAVSCTFMVVQAAELAMSMGILYATGAPANWCRPFSFADVNKGFQVVLDFLI
jgi:hypothetical protein